MTAPVGCPVWCDGRHGPRWRVHQRETGEVSVGDLAIWVDVVQYAPDRVPVVNVTYHDAEESRSTNLTVADAVALRDALTAAIDTIGGAG